MNNEFNVELAKCGSIVKNKKGDLLKLLVSANEHCHFFVKYSDLLFILADEHTEFGLTPIYEESADLIMANIEDWRAAGFKDEGYIEKPCECRGIEQPVDVELLKKRITSLELCLDDAFNGLISATEEIAQWGNFCDEEIQRKHNLDRDVDFYRKLVDKVEDVISKV